MNYIIFLGQVCNLITIFPCHQQLTVTHQQQTKVGCFLVLIYRVITTQIELVMNHEKSIRTTLFDSKKLTKTYFQV